MTPHKQKAGSTRPSLLPILPREPSKGSRCDLILPEGRPFAAGGSSQVFVPADPDSPRKVDMQDHAHLSSLKSGEPRWPAPVHP